MARTTEPGTRPPKKPVPKSIRNAARRAALDLEPTEAGKWQSSARRAVPLELPSGNVCLAVNRGLKAFMKDGKIPNALMPLVEGAINEAKGIKPKEVVDTLKDLDSLTEVLGLIDHVVLASVTAPFIEEAPKQDERGRDIDDDGNPFHRDPEILYVDELDMDDKMFVFQWAIGGTDDVEAFRKESQKLVGELQGSEGVAQETE